MDLLHVSHNNPYHTFQMLVGVEMQLYCLKEKLKELG